MVVRRAALVAAAALLVGCGDGDGETSEKRAASTPTPTAAPGEPDPAPAPGGASGAGSPYVGSLSVDPGSGTLIAGTGTGLFRLEKGAKRAEPFEGRLTAPQGEAAISSNLVLRFRGPDRLVASGHPGSESPVPEDLGLIESSDGGATWKPVSLLGKEDFHALDVRGDVVVGQPVEEARLLVSENGGRSFAERTPPEMPTDVDLDPASPRTMVVATRQGIYGSTDAGRSWRQRDVLTVEAHLAWAESGTLFRVEAGGAVRTSDDGGKSWKDAGDVGGPPSTATVDREGRLYVALAGAIIKRSDDGGRTFTELARLTS